MEIDSCKVSAGLWGPGLGDSQLSDVSWTWLLSFLLLCLLLAPPGGCKLVASSSQDLQASRSTREMMCLLGKLLEEKGHIFPQKPLGNIFPVLVPSLDWVVTPEPVTVAGRWDWLRSHMFCLRAGESCFWGEKNERDVDTQQNKTILKKGRQD